MYFLNQQHVECRKWRNISFSPSISHEGGLDYFQRVRSILSHCLPVCQLPIIQLMSTILLRLIILYEKEFSEGGAVSIALDFHCIKIFLALYIVQRTQVLGSGRLIFG